MVLNFIILSEPNKNEFQNIFIILLTSFPLYNHSNKEHNNHKNPQYFQFMFIFSAKNIPVLSMKGQYISNLFLVFLNGEELPKSIQRRAYYPQQPLNFSSWDLDCPL